MTSVKGPNEEETGVHPSAVGSNIQPPTKSKDDDASGTPRDNEEAAPPPETGVHPSAVGSNMQPPTKDVDVRDMPPDSDYPEQKHAGRVGYGPNYRQKPGFEDKLTGLKEEIKGKVKRDPELTQRGHDRITGELKKKEMEEDMKEDPFADPEEKKKDQQNEEAPKETPKEEEKQQE